MNPEFWSEHNFTKSSDYRVAERVADNRTKNIKQVYTLHGERSETKKELKPYENITSFPDSEYELSTEDGLTLVIDGPMERSYCLYGLTDNTVVFINKIKHVMIRDCHNTKIYVNNGSIAGIDVLFGCNVSIRTPRHNFANIEHSSNTQLGGKIDQDSLIHVTNSLDVSVNKKNLQGISNMN
jgi:hypothetical protein